MDDKVLEEIRFHQDVVTKDANSPLFQIREKEMEISGRVLAARTQAEKMVADARQNATQIVQVAQTESERLAKERSEAVLAESEATVATIRSQSEIDTVELEQALSARQEDAIDLVVKLVTTA
jgi:vacuolar-type H+-ATPase subunit H